MARALHSLPAMTIASAALAVPAAMHPAAVLESKSAAQEDAPGGGFASRMQEAASAAEESASHSADASANLSMQDARATRGTNRTTAHGKPSPKQPAAKAVRTDTAILTAMLGLSQAASTANIQDATGSTASSTANDAAAPAGVTAGNGAQPAQLAENSALSASALATSNPTEPAPTVDSAQTTDSSPEPGGPLSFAVRVTPATPAAPGNTPAVRGTQAQSGEAQNQDRKDQDASDIAPAASTEIAATHRAAQTFELDRQIAAAPVVSHTPVQASASVSRIRPVEPTPLAVAAKPLQALKEISLQVGAGATERVDIRLSTQAGELHVAVHTPDTDLAHGLQQSLPDLVGKLQDSGYRPDAWKPVQGTTGVAAGSESTRGGNESRQGGDGQSQSFSGGSQQQGGQRNSNQSGNRPHWVEALEANLAGARSTGVGNGLSS